MSPIVLSPIVLNQVVLNQVVLDKAVLDPVHPLRKRLAALADALAVAVGVTLPWSVSAAGVAIALWLIAALPGLDWTRLRQCLRHAAAAMPVLLLLLALVALAWSPAETAEGFGNLKTFARLVLIVVLLVQFQYSPHAPRVAIGFLVSCTALLMVSWLFWLFPAIAWPSRYPAVPVKDYIIQSSEFLICAFALAHLAFDAWRAGKRSHAAALGALALMFLANLAYVATSRSALVGLVALTGLFIAQRLGGKQALVAAMLPLAVAMLAWLTSPHLQSRVQGVVQEVSDYRSRGAESSSGYRLEFWTRSLVIVAQAPLIGHGTGAQRDAFRRTAQGNEGLAAAVTNNPHNQTLVVAIQFGALGTILLFAMWLSHWLLFRGEGLAAWIGAALVVQNVVAGLFNTSLYEFTHAWMYIFGVGTLGAMALQARRVADERGGQEQARDRQVGTRDVG
ncbi:MAG: O-antigen ligase family protein [Hyphomicrobiales bacterium]|nr:O-antigen ligase family protein [Hyphomicrobiales bacterium]